MQGLTESLMTPQMEPVMEEIMALDWGNADDQATNETIVQGVLDGWTDTVVHDVAEVGVDEFV